MWDCGPTQDTSGLPCRWTLGRGIRWDSRPDTPAPARVLNTVRVMTFDAHQGPPFDGVLQPVAQPSALAASVAPVTAPDATRGPTPVPLGVESLSFVMDVPVELTVELGRKRVRINDVLRLGPGSVLELSKASGEPLDILVNDRLVARGEAVVIGERYGVRITEVRVLDEARTPEGK